MLRLENISCKYKMNIWHSFTYSFYIPKYPVGGLPHDSVVNSLPTMQELQETRI